MISKKTILEFKNHAVDDIVLEALQMVSTKNFYNIPRKVW